MHSIWCYILPIGFLAYSLPLFLHFNAISHYVIDEEWHIPQGLAYCERRFNVWDDKITTLPGLYYAAVMLGPFQLCNITALRAISLLAAAINIALFYQIRRRTLGIGSSASGAALDAISLAMLPPLYFFSHLYYTDALALSTVLLTYKSWLQKQHAAAAVFAGISVLMRQTNIVWACMLGGITALDAIFAVYASSYNRKVKDVSLCESQIYWDLLRRPALLWLCFKTAIASCFYYLLVVACFLLFVMLNGGIVVGDRSAHQAQLHMPQLFYFSLFTACFGCAHTASQLLPALRLAKRKLLCALIVIIVCAFIVRYNTLVHPYLLADNRHYAFYIWQRFYARNWWCRYAVVPAYCIALTMLVKALSHKPSSFQLMYGLAIFLSLCFQRLFELRYFLVPYALFRLNTLPRRYAHWQLVELAVSLLINAATFYIYFTKQFYWSDSTQPQRIIW